MHSDTNSAEQPLTLDNSLSEIPDISLQPQSKPLPYASPYGNPNSQNTSNLPSFPFSTNYHQDDNDPQEDDDAAFLLRDNTISDKNTEDGYKDKIFSIIFGVHIVIILVLAFVLGVPNIRYFNLTPAARFKDHWSQGLTMISIFFATGLIGTAGSILWFLVLQKYAAHMISATLILGTSCFAIASLTCFSYAGAGGTMSGLIMLLLTMGSFVYYLYVRNRIPFAAANLNIANRIIHRFPATIYCAFVAIVVQMAWILIWGIAMLGVWFTMVGNMHGTNVGANFTIVLLLISFFWGLQVIRNVVHCVTAGTVGDWWYNVAPVYTVSRSLKRCLTTSFGSICYGSLVVAFLQATRVVLSTVKRKRSRRINACLEWFVRVVEKTVQYLNKYAFCQVALYGKDFKSAGIHSMGLFRERGWSAIVNDDLISGVLSIGCLIVGSLTGVFGGGWIYSTVRCPVEIESSSCDTSSIVLMSFTICMIIGYAMCAIVSSIVDSAVATIYVCFAQDPTALQLTNPQEFNRIVDAWQLHHPQTMAQSGAAYAIISV